VATVTTLTKAIKIIIIIIIIRKDALNILVAHNSKIVVNAIHLIYVKFAVELAIVLRSIYLKNKSVKRVTLNIYIVIGFRRE
jgi:hypothetical protein